MQGLLKVAVIGNCNSADEHVRCITRIFVLLECLPQGVLCSISLLDVYKLYILLFCTMEHFYE